MKFYFLTRKVFVLLLCIEILSGCASLDPFWWNNSRQVAEPSRSSAADGSLLFFLDKKGSGKQKGSSALAHNSFPFSAPAIELPSPRLEVNHEVRRELSNYLRANGRSISQGLKRQQDLFPVLAKIFRDEGLPEELLNLALIESGFRAEAYSQAGAAGIWQFMSSTARLYGLEVSGRVDERKDPILSTIAAARHLKDLYARFNDWYLVLAAYNAGEGAVSKAISSSSRNDYWTIVRNGKVAPETARFVPKFIAASILQKLYQRYGNDVQLAQYVDRHVVRVASDGSKVRYAFNMESEALLRRG